MQGIEQKIQYLQYCVAPVYNQCYYDQLLQSIPSISAETILSVGFTDDDDDSDSHVVVNDGAEHTAAKAKQERPKSMSVSPVTAQLSAETSKGKRKHRSPTRMPVTPGSAQPTVIQSGPGPQDNYRNERARFADYCTAIKKKFHSDESLTKDELNEFQVACDRMRKCWTCVLDIHEHY